MNLTFQTSLGSFLICHYVCINLGSFINSCLFCELAL